MSPVAFVVRRFNQPICTTARAKRQTVPLVKSTGEATHDRGLPDTSILAREVMR